MNSCELSLNKPLRAGRYADIIGEAAPEAAEKEENPGVRPQAAASAKQEGNRLNEQEKHRRGANLRRAHAGRAAYVRARRAAHVRHVRRDRAGADADGPFGQRDAALRGPRHAALPPAGQGQGPGLPGLELRLHRGLRRRRAHAARRGGQRHDTQRRDAALRLLRRGLRGPRLPRAGGGLQGLRSQARHALLPAHCHRPHYNKHRPLALEQRRGQLLRQLARGPGRHPGRHRLQHLGQGAWSRLSPSSSAS